MASEQRKAQWRAARARARARAREAGRCVACLTALVPKNRTTCKACGQRANVAKRRRAAKLASSALAQAAAYGIDLTMLFRNLRLTPEERLAKAERALRTARDLRAMRSHA